MTSQAQNKILAAGNTAIQWAKECIESNSDLSVEDYVPAADLYPHYTMWCKANGVNPPMPRIRFAQSLSEHFLCGFERFSVAKRIGSKVIRVYRRMRWKKEDEDGV